MVFEPTHVPSIASIPSGTGVTVGVTVGVGVFAEPDDDPEEPEEEPEEPEEEPEELVGEVSVVFKDNPVELETTACVGTAADVLNGSSVDVFVRLPDSESRPCNVE